MEKIYLESSNVKEVFTNFNQRKKELDLFNSVDENWKFFLDRYVKDDLSYFQRLENRKKQKNKEKSAIAEEKEIPSVASVSSDFSSQRTYSTGSSSVADENTMISGGTKSGGFFGRLFNSKQNAQPVSKVKHNEVLELEKKRALMDLWFFQVHKQLFNSSNLIMKEDILAASNSTFNKVLGISNSFSKLSTWQLLLDFGVTRTVVVDTELNVENIISNTKRGYVKKKKRQKQLSGLPIAPEALHQNKSASSGVLGRVPTSTSQGSRSSISSSSSLHSTVDKAASNYFTANQSSYELILSYDLMLCKNHIAFEDIMINFLSNFKIMLKPNGHLELFHNNFIPNYNNYELLKKILRRENVAAASLDFEKIHTDIIINQLDNIYVKYINQPDRPMSTLNSVFEALSQSGYVEIQKLTVIIPRWMNCSSAYYKSLEFYLSYWEYKFITNGNHTRASMNNFYKLKDLTFNGLSTNKDRMVLLGINYFSIIYAKKP